MNRNQEDLIKILSAYAAGINGSLLGYHAEVDKSGAIPQLNVH